MKKMEATSNFVVLNYGWLLLALAGVIAIIIAYKKITIPAPVVPTTQSANFATDSLVSTPVMAHNLHADVFRAAAQAAISDGTNPWIYLSENWEKVGLFKGGVEAALLDFIQNEAGKTIPKNPKVTLSIRDYSNENSVVMEYRDPATDSILVATGHDPEPSLYATFAGSKDTMTFKLVCMNGLVRELGGQTTTYDQDYVIKPFDSFIGITGSTPTQAVKFADENDLEVRFIVQGKVNSKTPNTSRVKVFKNYQNFRNGIFDAVLQPGDILRKQDGKWLYIRQNQHQRKVLPAIHVQN